MRVDAFLADSVVSAEGKLYAQGIGWNMINAVQFPAQHERLGIGLVVHIPYTATNQQHTVAIRIEKDGEVLGLNMGGEPPEGEERLTKIEAGFNVGRPPNLPAGAEQVIALAVNLNLLVFPQPGAYEVVLTIDGMDDEDRLTFLVQQLAVPTLTPGHP